jgi:phage-related minor tail protein
MSGVEVATGYLSLTASAKGLGQSIAREVTPELERVGDDAGELASKSFGSKFADGAKKVAAAAGVATSSALGVGFASAQGFEVSNDRLAAQLGINNPDFAADLGKTAGKIYAGNFGDSIEGVNAGLKAVLSEGLVPEDATNEQIQSITQKALALSDVFGQDVAGSAAAAGQLIKTGLAKDATEAFDIMTRGFQQGVDKRGDFLDTLNEYGVQFQKLGLDAKTATGILSQGLKGGARDADLVADSLKEFSIRAIDGSKTTADGFKALGLDAGMMAAAIAKGGDSASSALDLTLDKLRAIPDPVARSQAAVALFGTQAEDMGNALFKLDPTNAVNYLGDIEGAADKAANTVSGNATSAFESFRRTAEVKLAGVATAFGPVLSAAPGLAGIVSIFGSFDGVLGKVASGVASTGKAIGSGILTAVQGIGTGLSAAGSAAASAGRAIASGLATGASAAANLASSIGSAVVSFVSAGAQMVASAARTAASVAISAATQVASWIATAAAAVASAVAVAAAWLVAAAPFILAGLAIAALVYIVVRNFDTIKTVIVEAWHAVAAATSAVWEALKSAVGTALEVIKSIFLNFTGPGLIIKHFQTIKDTVLGAFDAVRDGIRSGVDAIVGFFSGMGGRLAAIGSGIFDFLKTAFKGAINFVIRGWNSLKFKVPSVDLGPVGKFGGMTIGVPAIPLLAAGGTAIQPGWSIVGENGPELRYLPKGASVVPLEAPSTATASKVVGVEHLHTSPGQSPAEIGRIAARETAWAIKT